MPGTDKQTVEGLRRAYVDDIQGRISVARGQESVATVLVACPRFDHAGVSRTLISDSPSCASSKYQ